MGFPHFYKFVRYPFRVCTGKSTPLPADEPIEKVLDRALAELRQAEPDMSIEFALTGLAKGLDFAQIVYSFQQTRSQSR